MQNHLRLACQAVAACSITLSLNHVYQQEHGFWSTMTVLFLLTNSQGEMLKNGIIRVVMTIIACLLAGVLIFLLPHESPVLYATIFLCLFGALYFFNIDYAKAVFFITVSIMIVLLVALGETNRHLLLARMEQNAIGAVVAVIVSIFFLPRSAQQELSSLRQQIINELFYWHQQNAEQSKERRADYDDLFKLLDKLHQYHVAIEFVDYENWFLPRRPMHTNHFEEKVLLQLMVGNTLHLIQTIELHSQSLSATQLANCRSAVNRLFNYYQPRLTTISTSDNAADQQPLTDHQQPLPIVGLNALLDEQHRLFKQL